MTAPAAPGPPAPVPARAERLWSEVEQLRRVRVDLAVLRDAWARAAPELVGSLDGRAELADALAALAAAGRLVLPAAGSWERSPRPALPRFVTVPTARRTRREPRWRSRAWHPHLGWVASLQTLSDAGFDALVAVDSWLRRGSPDDDRLLPMRVRSAEIFGVEKLLDSLSTSALFDGDRLSLKMLGARRFPPPLVCHRVGPGPDVLVVENADTFWLCRQLLADQADGRLGRLAWGAGAAFEASVAALELEDIRPERVWYWGDLDPKGVRIPTTAARVAAAAGLPELEPAGPLWEAMAALPAERCGCDWSAVPSGWLGERLWSACTAAREIAGRVAQESVSPEAVSAALHLVS